MEKTLVHTIKIIHHKLRCGEYRFLANFFRMIGSYVVECQDLERKLECDYDAIIIIKDRLNDENVENILKKYAPRAFGQQGISLEKVCDNEKKKFLYHCLDLIERTFP